MTEDWEGDAVTRRSAEDARAAREADAVVISAGPTFSVSVLFGQCLTLSTA